jgi:hypothetical protein
MKNNQDRRMVAAIHSQFRTAIPRGMVDL